MTLVKSLLLLLVCIFFVKNSHAESFFSSIAIKIDTNLYNSEKHTFAFQNDKYLFFKYVTGHEVAEVFLYTDPSKPEIQEIQILGTSEFQVLDSFKLVLPNVFKARIKFLELENTSQVNLVLSLHLNQNKYVNTLLKFFPYNDTYVRSDEASLDLFLDEERTIELPCNFPSNVRTVLDLPEDSDFDVKVSPSINSVKLRIKPRSLGQKNLEIKLKTIRPFPYQGRITTDLPPLVLKLLVRPNRVEYINTEKSTIYFNTDIRASEEILIDLAKNMSLRKTYRIEDNQESGGNLIAELFTMSQVANTSKVLCKLRTFSLHKMTDGYLYVKDGDKTRFITNFNIIEKPRIDEVSVLRDGEEWSNALNVYPGERFEVKIKGTGLLNSVFTFEGVDNVFKDTARNSDEVAFFTLKLPISIPKKKINVYMNKRATEYTLNIREFQSPKDFSFIKINYNGQDVPLSNSLFNKPIFYEKKVNDINITFDPEKIDENNKLYGKQYVDIEIRVVNSRNELIELQTINTICICPGETSPRSAFYDHKDCSSQYTINLNDKLVRKTYTMEGFSQIFITIRHNELKHGNQGFTRKVKLIMDRRNMLDVQVSFPVGLLQYKFNTGKTNVENFYGISIAFIAQWQFYEKNQINRFKPYSVGAGFVALDAFNFSQNNQNRDLGIVALGTMTPINRTKLSFPLYAGGGYLVNQRSFFVLFGPGLTFRF